MAVLLARRVCSLAMNPSIARLPAAAVAAFMLLIATGCPANEATSDAGTASPDAAPANGTVTFPYVLLNNEGEPLAAIDCAAAGPGVTAIRFLVGDDGSADGRLDDVEVQGMAEAPCNQLDANSNGTLEPTELGSYLSMELPAGDYDLFAVEVISAGSTPVAWQTFDIDTNAERFSFGGGLAIAPPPAVTMVPFPGNGQFAGELQIFLGF